MLKRRIAVFFIFLGHFEVMAKSAQYNSCRFLYCLQLLYLNFFDRASAFSTNRKKPFFIPFSPPKIMRLDLFFLRQQQAFLPFPIGRLLLTFFLFSKPNLPARCCLSFLSLPNCQFSKFLYI